MKRLTLIPLLFVVTGISARADVASRASDSLGTRVNGVLGGRCQSGLCRITGGSDSGRNRFHRLSEFDTRGAIQGVSIDSKGISNLVLGVTAVDGSFIDKSVSLSSPAHLFVLSPGGIQLMPGASFQQIPQLTLSTAPQLRFEAGVFDVFNTSLTAIPELGGDPLPGALGLLSGDLADRRPLIRMEGVSLDIDESLLVDAPGGRVDVLNSRLSVSNDAGDGGSLTLTGDLVSVGEGSQLLATGTGEGGVVQVGGSWQNSDPAVRQASQTWMKPGSVVDASSTSTGDGGTVVIWSDFSNPSGGTVAQGTLLARGGARSGSGGSIETSGPYLVAEPELVDVSAANGLSGEWLLDPVDITIAAGAPGPGFTDINAGAPVAGNSLFESSAGGNRVQVSTLLNQLNTANVRIKTGPGAGAGNITVADPVDYSAKAKSLTLEADNDIVINASIDSGPNLLSLDADGDILVAAPVASASGSINFVAGNDITLSSTITSATAPIALTANRNVSVNADISSGTGAFQISATTGYLEGANAATVTINGPTTFLVGDAGNTSNKFASVLVGSAGTTLSKTGAGRLIISGASPNWRGDIVVTDGILRAENSSSLGNSAGTNVAAGKTLELVGSGPGLAFDENIELNLNSNLVNVSGRSSISQPVVLRSSANIDVQSGTLILNPASGDSVSAGFGVAPSLTFLGDGDLEFADALNLGNNPNPVAATAFGDFTQTGAGTARFNESLQVASVRSTGGGTVWMDQRAGASVLPSGSSIFLDNGSVLRRDRTETVTGTNLQLGAGGGGISVGRGYFLTWDSAVTGSGSFTKSGSGDLKFPSTANINYTGDTIIAAGNLFDNSSSGAVGGGVSSVAGTGGSDVIASNPQSDQPSEPQSEPNPEPEPSPEPVVEQKPEEEPEIDDLVSEFGEDQVDELVVIAEVSVLTPADSSSAPGSDSSSNVSGGSVATQVQAVGSSLQVDVGGGSESTISAATTAAPPPAASGTPQAVAPEQASAQFQQSDEASTSRTAALLGLPQNGQRPAPRSVEDIQNILSRVEREGLVPNPAVLQVRFTQQALAAADVEARNVVSLVPKGFEQLDYISGENPYVDEGFSAQAFVQHGGEQLYASATGASGVGALSGSSARSEVIQASNGQNEDAFLDLTLVGSEAPVEARRVSLNRGRFSTLLKALYRQLSRQEPLGVDDPASPSRQLHALLVAPLLESLKDQDIETVLIAADQGLQAVPFAALSDGNSFFGEKYAFGLTPSLALTPLAPSQASSGRQLALGASEFENLAPLPLVPQELEQLDASDGTDRYLNDDFSPQAFLSGAADQRYHRVHVATHADFRPGGPAQSVLHTGTGPMSMSQLAQLRSQRRGSPLDLIVFSACRTLLGDPDSELGFAGLALQAGARSAVGTLWYVDDVVTSAFFVQFYRLLDQGLPKAEALQRTRQLFASGAIQLQEDAVVGAGEAPLLTGLTPVQRRRIAGGVQNPYFWAGIQLIGSPW